MDKRVTKRRRKSDAVEYLIKWLGYGHEHNGWEPAKALANAQEMVQTFENNHISVRAPKNATPCCKRRTRH